METKVVKLTERQLGVLKTFGRIRDSRSLNSRDLTSPEYFEESVRGYWATPLDFGGHDGSHHSTTARQLAEKGLIDRYKNGRVNNFKSRTKGSCCYRINAAGIDFLARITPAAQESEP